MCLAEKCFFCVPLDLGCSILGILTSIFASFLALSSSVLLIIECTESGRGSVYLESFPQLVMNASTAIIILAAILILAKLWTLFSVMLFLGVRKNKPSFLLWYFSFGIIMTILCMLSALLVLLENHWILSLILFIISMIYIHCLVVVHTTYDLMQSGTVFKFSHRRLSDETVLVNSMDDC